MSEEEPPEYYPDIQEHDFTNNKYASNQVDLVKKLKEFGFTPEQLRSSDVFEQLILKYVRQNEECADIPEVNASDCSFIYKVMPLANFVIINYKTLSEEYLSKICKFYREKYNMESYTLVEFEDMLANGFGSYLTGHIHGNFKFDNAICLDMTPLCEKVFQDLKTLM
jgi:hypothetical protein